MKSLLKENYEKWMLAVLLTLLAGASIICILEANAEGVPNIVGGGKVVAEDKIPKVEGGSLTRLVAGDVKDLEGFVYCRNSECNYLIHKSLVKCNWCSTPIVAVEVINKDKNRNGIEDKLELSWGLKLDDPNEILRDKDGDGFSTKDEYERDFSPADSSSHPPLILRASFEVIRDRYIPFKIRDIVISEDVRGNRRVYVDGVHAKRGSFYLSPGEDTEWLKILNAGIEAGRKYAELQYFDYKFKMFKGEKKQYEGWPKYVIKNNITEKIHLVSMGSEFVLKTKNGAEEAYRLVEYNEEQQMLEVINKELSSEFEVYRKPVLKEAVK
ncbi:MAG: hypothetical protein NE327_06720 [Lentisphaeraceae bacterium]|nr:hypothetical protein [Lentisphaeraceae bacterium]